MRGLVSPDAGRLCIGWTLSACFHEKDSNEHFTHNHASNCDCFQGFELELFFAPLSAGHGEKVGTKLSFTWLRTPSLIDPPGAVWKEGGGRWVGVVVTT